MNKKNVEIFMLCESNILRSGEFEFYVDAYLSCERAEKDMSEQVNARIKENNAYIVYDTGKEILIEDEEENKYKFWIEAKVLVK